MDEHRTSVRARRHRSRGWNYWLYWSAFLFALIAMGFISRGVVSSRSVRGNHVVRSASQRTFGDTGAGQSISSGVLSVFSPRRRRLYPYSVIPGGIGDARELRNAVAHDPLIAAHYADFDLSRARVVRLDRDKAVHVSFRLNDRVYWTRKTLTLHAGETVISDGVHEARTRCGNRISVAPEGPVSPKEPPAEAMDVAPALPLVAEVPETWPDPSPLVPLVSEPPGNSISPNPPVGWIIPPPYYPTSGDGPHPNPVVVPPPVATPEPSTLVLLALGLLPLARFARIAKKCARISFLHRKNPRQSCGA